MCYHEGRKRGGFHLAKEFREGLPGKVMIELQSKRGEMGQSLYKNDLPELIGITSRVYGMYEIPRPHTQEHRLIS